MELGEFSPGKNARMVSEETGRMRSVKIGFSWTEFFFGFFVPLFRGDWKWFGILLIATIAIGVLFNESAAGTLVTLLQIGFAFFYNKFYIKDLLVKGFVGENEQTQRWIEEYTKEV